MSTQPEAPPQTVQAESAGTAAVVAEHLATAPPSRFSVVFKRFRRNTSALAGLIAIVLLFVLAFAGPFMTHWSYADIDYSALRDPPSVEHWLGTNPIGQDVFAQTVRGLQKSLLIGLLVAVFSTGVAAAVGTAAGYFGGWTDRIAMFFVDLLLVFPPLLIIAVVSPGMRTYGWLAFVGILAVLVWMITARVIRSMTLSLKQQEFVRVARFAGVRPVRIILRHILPNVASFLIIDATITVGSAVMFETALSYFGFGVQPPDVSLGTLIAAGTGSALTYPWMFFFSAGLLVVFVLAINLVGDGLRDALDPTSDRTRRRFFSRKGRR
ncbi:ABC transporter permease [Fodinicola acaciae]|uniref:ABC transporter permease n=1 Tax=Fodinicola acaciae TaxID=2681555 RepID=UPI0013D54995|nr:ABC transporter permease [Fodinicola acaciae]